MQKVKSIKDKIFKIHGQTYMAKREQTGMFALYHRVGKWYNRRWNMVYSTKNKTLFRKYISERLSKL